MDNGWNLMKSIEYESIISIKRMTSILKHHTPQWYHESKRYIDQHELPYQDQIELFEIKTYIAKRKKFSLAYLVLLE